MKSRSERIALLCSVASFVVCQAGAWAHGGIERVSEVSPAELRVFVADGATGDLLSLDLPDGSAVSRISTPPFIMSLALSADSRHLFVMRGRDTDRDFVTVVNTGLSDVAGEFWPPYVDRTLPVNTPGPGDHNQMLTVGGKDAQFMEGTGEVLVMDNADFTGYDALRVRSYKLGGPDHYFYVESGENLYIGHLRRGYIQVLNRDTGEEVTRIEGCPLVHGKTIDETSGRLFFACMRDIVVIGTRGDEMNQLVARIPYPEKQRVGAFYFGSGRIIWAYTEGILPIIYRLDASVEPYQLEVLPLDPSIRQFATEGGKYFLSLARTGALEIRDGFSGKVLRTVEVAKPFVDEYHEHTNKAILPDIKSLGSYAYVSLPHEGRIAVVDIDTGKVQRYLETGGEPTRIVLVEAHSQTDNGQTAKTAGR